MTISTPLGIVTILAFFFLALVALLRAPREDIKAIIKFLTRWFRK